MSLKWIRCACVLLPLVGAFACGSAYPLWPGDAGNQTFGVATTTLAVETFNDGQPLTHDAGPGVEDAGNVGVEDAGNTGVECALSDAGPSPDCCQPNGNSCNEGTDCCSSNCILRGTGKVCCVQGGCP